MASAIVRGILDSGRAGPEKLYCTCGNDLTGQHLAEATGIHFAEDPGSILSTVDLFLLACKPQQLKDLPASLFTGTSGKLVVSILAGIPINRLSALSPLARNVVRVMPNTPAQIGKGISVYASRDPLSEEDQSIVESLLSSMGSVVSLPEDLMDAVTALSGSGPAYLFEFTRILTEAGKDIGLSNEVSSELARQTIIGSAALMESRSDATPSELVDEVTSPGGTTEAALQSFGNNFERVVVEALRAARDRSRELSSL